MRHQSELSENLLIHIRETKAIDNPAENTTNII